jgi:hypothetical protein
MPVPHTRIRGTLRYTSDKPDRKGQERGREHFTITKHADGKRTLRAYVEIDDAPNVMRDVTLSVGADWRPTDCFVRLSVGDAFMGSSWFQFTDSEALCEGYTVNEGRISQRMALKGPIDAFGTHPIQGDAWLMNVVSLEKPGVSRHYRNIMMCSLDHRGATGPILMPHQLGVPMAFIGRERISVAAGTFDALHYRLTETSDDAADTRNEPGKHPPYDLWVTADGEYVMLLATVTGYMMTRYELTEYERVDARA